MNKKNRNISVCTRLNEAMILLSEAFQILEEYPNLHYPKEYVRSLWSLTKEIRQELEDGYFSLEYIDEQLSKIRDCAEEIKKK